MYSAISPSSVRSSRPLQMRAEISSYASRRHTVATWLFSSSTVMMGVEIEGVALMISLMRGHALRDVHRRHTREVERLERHLRGRGSPNDSPDSAPTGSPGSTIARWYLWYRMSKK